MPQDTQTLLESRLEHLLVSGSDTRAVVDGRTGLNRYGCAPAPRTGALNFGSCTASSISETAFRAVEDARDRLLSQSPSTVSLDGPMEALRLTLKELLGLAPADAEVIFSPSGTDSVLHALFLARALHGGKPLDCLLAAPEETGSGVPEALAGRHFGTVTAEGVSVTQGGPIEGLAEGITLRILPMGASACRDQELFEAVARSVAAGRRVLLQVMDSSKLGVRTPSADCLQRIHSRFGEDVCVVVDACQMRLSRTRLHWHLTQGHLVLISGSKFFGGPPFSGALLVPAGISRILGGLRQVPAGLWDYTHRSAWPPAWGCLRAALPERVNLGQYFRWIAALDEIRRYFDVPQAFRRTALCRFASLSAPLLRERSADLKLLEICSTPLEDWEEAEMSAKTIFPFLVRQGDRWMSFAEATALYHALNQDVTRAFPAHLGAREKAVAATLCHLGQPVRVSLEGGQTAGALRLCAGARTVTELWSRQRRDPTALDLTLERHAVTTILDKIALVKHHLLGD